MKSFLYVLATVLGVTFFLTGCDIITKQPGAVVPPPGSDLIVSEVFTLSPDKYYNYSWIEVYNPARASFRWFEQTFPAITLVVGSEGRMIYTDDGGESVQSLAPVTNKDLYSVSFSHPDSGVVVGQDGVIFMVRRIDDEWRAEPLVNPDPAKKTLRDVQLIPFPGRAGFMVGDSGGIWRTTNRGSTWLNFTSSRIRQNLHSVNFVNFDKIYAVGDSGTLLKSVSALTWRQKALPEEINQKTCFYSCAFISDTGFVVGEGGVILKTQNAGEVWIKKEVPEGTATLRSVFMSAYSSFNYKQVWVVGDNGTILKSTDFGENWEEKESGTDGILRHVTFVDSLRGYAFGDGGTILFSFDGGESWNLLSYMTDVNWYDAFFNPPNVRIRNRYVLEMWGMRQQFLSNVDLINPTQTVVNYDYITKTDTGIILFDPAIYQDLLAYWRAVFGGSPLGSFIPQQLRPIFTTREIKNVPAGGFTIINNDSTRFSNHTKLGPGQVNVVSATIGYIYDETSIWGVNWFRWNLLPSSEIRLVKYEIKEDLLTGDFIGYVKKTIDVVRWGNFTPTTWLMPTDSLWPANKPAGYIPTWNSLARYANDMGTTDPRNLNSATSFYFAEDPLPGWYSQRRK